MHSKFFFFLFFLLFSFSLCAQSDSLFVEIDTTEVITAINEIKNNKVLNPIFEKLVNLQKSKVGKLNIVHIGDSHIQADLFSGLMRKNLQQQFGNAGRGLVFPHSLVKTNGTGDVRFSSNQTWESQRNIYPNTGKLWGIA